jgi:hypothetical protein
MKLNFRGIGMFTVGGLILLPSLSEATQDSMQTPNDRPELACMFSVVKGVPGTSNLQRGLYTGRLGKVQPVIAWQFNVAEPPIKIQFEGMARPGAQVYEGQLGRQLDSHAMRSLKGHVISIIGEWRRICGVDAHLASEYTQEIEK